MATFQTTGPIDAHVELRAGDITIVATEQTGCTITVTPRDEGKPLDVEAAATAIVDFANGRLTVKTIKARRGLSKHEGSVVVTVEIPTGSTLDASTGFGAIRTEGELATTRARSGMGNLHLDSVGDLEAQTGFGDVSATSTGDAKAKTGTGTIRFGTVHGSARLKNANGVVEVDECSKDLHVRTSSGDITIGRARACVSAGSAAGDIRIGEVSSGSVGVRTGAGSIAIGIREGCAAWLELNSGFGSVRNGLTVTPAPIENESKVEVRARTGAGDITIDRAA